MGNHNDHHGHNDHHHYRNHDHDHYHDHYYYYHDHNHYHNPPLFQKHCRASLPPFGRPVPLLPPPVFVLMSSPAWSLCSFPHHEPTLVPENIAERLGLPSVGLSPFSSLQTVFPPYPC